MQVSGSKVYYLKGAATVLELGLVNWASKQFDVLAVTVLVLTCFVMLQVSGSKFYYLKGAATLLELALVNWAISRVAAKGFTMLSTPDLVRVDVLEKCGFQPRMENTQVCCALLATMLT